MEDTLLMCICDTTIYALRLIANHSCTNLETMMTYGLQLRAYLGETKKIQNLAPTNEFRRKEKPYKYKRINCN